MLCEKCKKRPASVYYNYTLNGLSKDIRLCSECAEELAFNGNNSGVDDSLFSGLFGEYFGKSSYIPFITTLGQNTKAQQHKEKICPSCGMSESEFHRGGRFGCKECYTTFESTVKEILGKLHVSCEYKGKLFDGTNSEMSLERRIEKLRTEMHSAVEKQDYEEAARLRDAIKMLESSDTIGNAGGNV